MPIRNSSGPLVPTSQALPTLSVEGNEAYAGLEDCPPRGATTGPKTLFRLVLNDPPQPSDLLTTAEENKHPDGDACRRHSVSTYASLSHAERCRKNVNFFKNHRIASGNIPKDAGKMKRTSRTPGHWSWWPSPSCVRHSYFLVIA